METNFFTAVSSLHLGGTLQILISKGENGNLVVAVMPKSDNDIKNNLIIPYTLTGTPELLNAHFFAKITQPVQEATELIDNMERFQQQLQATKKEKDEKAKKTDKPKTEIDPKEKKFRDAMAKVDELEKAGKYTDAWMKVPEISDFPDRAEELRKRKSQLSAKFPPSLFGEAEEHSNPASPTDTISDCDIPEEEEQLSQIDEDEPYIH